MAECPVLVVLPTHTESVYEQKVLGKQSPLSSDLDEFRGIPFGVVPGRWQHSHVRDKLPQDVYFARSNGYVRYTPILPQLLIGIGPNVHNLPKGTIPIIGNPMPEFPADVTESEIDCLNLFIIRPSAVALARIGWVSGKKLPVLLWIHGGGYAFGAGTDPMWGKTYPGQLSH